MTNNFDVKQAQDFFGRLFASSKPVPFDPAWNIEEDNERPIAIPLRANQIVGSQDESGRRVLLMGTHGGAIALYDAQPISEEQPFSPILVTGPKAVVAIIRRGVRSTLMKSDIEFVLKDLNVVLMGVYRLMED